MKTLQARILAALVSLLLAGTALAADVYPSKPIRFVVCTAPGGATDLTTRLVAQKMSEKLGQPVIVDNRPGGDTLVGILYAKDQPADGYTVLAQSLGYSTLPYIKLNPRYTPSDFTGVGIMSRIPFILLVGGDEPEKNVGELVARAKKEKLAYGHGGIASAPHIAAETFLKTYGLEMTSVPYKGNGAVMPDVMAGRVSFFFDAYVSSGSHMRSGKMKALAVAAPERMAVLPNVPTFKELGTDFTYTVWLGLLVKSGTPPDVVAKLSEALRYALESKDVAERLRADGSDITFVSPQQFNDYLARESAEMGKVATEMNWTKD